jgi:hypothetical protein
MLALRTISALVCFLIPLGALSVTATEAGTTNAPPFRISALFRKADSLSIGLTHPETGWNAIIPVGGTKAGVTVHSCDFETELVRISHGGNIYDLKLSAGKKKLRTVLPKDGSFEARIAKGEITVVPIELTGTNWTDLTESTGARFDALVREAATNPPPNHFKAAVEAGTGKKKQPTQ